MIALSGSLRHYFVYCLPVRKEYRSIWKPKPPPSPSNRAGGWKKRLVFSAVVSAALTFTLCLFGPLDLFFNNYEEIWFHLQDIIGGLAVVAGIFFVLTTLVGTLLRGKLHDLYMALMFGGLVGTYVQGSFMNKNYGLLNGNSVDWSAYTGYGVVNTVVWVVCILVPLIAMLIWKEKKVRPGLSLPLLRPHPHAGRVPGGVLHQLPHHHRKRHPDQQTRLL